MLRWIAALSVVLLGSALSLPAEAQWKWRDRSGHTQYSDMPPPAGTAEKDVLSRPTAAQRSAAAPQPSAAASVIGLDAAASAGRGSGLTPRAVEPELETRRKQAEQVEADKRKAEEARVAATKADNCVRARAQLRTLDSGQRIARVNEKGERQIVDDAARAEETRRAQDGVTSNC